MGIKQKLDIYQTEYGKGYLLFERGVLISHFLPGSQQPESDYDVCRKPGILAHKMEDYFMGKKVDFNDRIRMTGTVFERNVYRACRKIPYGETLTYKELAETIDSKAYRAIGRALGKNKLPVIIPCHRVVGVKGAGGWNGPKGMKEMLLSLEMVSIVKS